MRVLQRIENHGNDSPRLLQNFEVVEAQHAQALGSEVFLPTLVSRGVVWLEVLATINLDHEVRELAVEVEDVRSERMLAAKFVAADVAVA